MEPSLNIQDIKEVAVHQEKVNACLSKNHYMQK